MATLFKDLLGHFFLVDTFCDQYGTIKSFKKLCDLDLKDPNIQNLFKNSSFSFVVFRLIIALNCFFLIL